MMSESQLRQQFEALSQQEFTRKVLSNYLAKCIQNNHHCAHCCFNHNDICFFAKECFENDQKYYREEDEE